MNPWPQRRRRFFRGSDAATGRPRLYRPVLESLEERCLLSGGYAQVDLASDVPGLARVTDPNLVNPWGISFSPTGPFWFANNGSGVSDLLDGRGHPVPLVVTVPLAAQAGGTPTGTVFNGGPGFIISENGISAPSRFLFATEDGTISGWSGVVDLTRTLVAVDHSTSGAVYKGLALAADPSGRSFLYAADFGRGTIDVFDQDFKPVARPGSFQDPNLPDGFAPFNIKNIHDLLFVTYAQHDDAGRDDVAGAGHGFIDVYDTGGNFVTRFASQGALNSPWGLALAPADFGSFGGALLVGNNGDGHINAYDLQSGAFLGPLADSNGIPITVPHLWALTFGNDHAGGASDTLFFTAGVDDEAHGLFGALQPPQRSGADTAGSGTFDPHAPGEPGDYPLPPSSGPAFQDRNDDSGLVTAILVPLTESSLALIPTLSTLPQPTARVETPALATAVGAIPFQRSVGTVLLVSRTSHFPFSAGDSRLPKYTQNNSLPLSAFLDLNAAQTLPENSARGQRPDINGDTVDARRSPSAGGDTGDKVFALDSSEGRPETAGDRTAGNKGVETRNHGSWTRVLRSLLVVVSIPVIWTLCRGPRAGHVSHSGKMLRVLWDQVPDHG